MDFNKHSDVTDALKDAQTIDTDMREAAREAGYFVDKRDGQWEPEIITRLKGKPRYTDDRTNPIINQIVGEIESADFSIKVMPSGGDASKENARILDGIIRNILNISNFDEISNQAARIETQSGLSGWEVVHDYADEDSFNQDLLISPINDFVDRVWFDPSDFSRDKRNSKWCIILDFVDQSEYEKRWPEGSKQSLSTDNDSHVYYHKKDFIIVGRLYYLTDTNKTLHLMSDGSVYEDDEKFEMVRDELELSGVTIKESRTRKTHKTMMRYFDASGWLSDAEETVFTTIPVIPVFANYKVQESKILYRGVVEKLMDTQRVHNYAFSRNVEEIALKPRDKYWLTRKQAQGNEDELETMNTNMDPVQFYTVDDKAPPPYFQDTSRVNAAVANLVESSDVSITRSAGLFAANMGDNPGLQSGIAIDKQIDKGNNGTSVYFEAIRVAMVRTGQILVDTIPKIYDAERKIRVLGEDGSYEMAIINQVVMDFETGEPVTLNDLTVGQYDVTCDIGAKYKNRQQETAEQFAMIAQRDPTILQIASDIWFKNMDAPGFDQVSERARAQMLSNGMIPIEQMTDEERKNYEEEQLANEQQPQGDPAAMMLAEAEMLKGQAEMLKSQNDQLELQIKAQQLEIETAKVQLARQGQIEKTQSETALNMAKIDQNQQQIDLQSQKQQMDSIMAMQKQQMETIQGLADTLKALKDATGADAIINPNTVEAYDNVAEDLNNATQ